MGTGWLTFHGAEHTRFGHSLGSLFIASKMINHLSMNHLKVAEYAPQILVSALLHDIGHGPLSHTAEKLVPVSHEEWTKRIIRETQISNILGKSDPKLTENVIKTIEYNSIPLYVSQIVSSYIDCDRLDYLHRDSYYVGVPYGLTGSNRIIASLDIDENSNKLVVNETTGLDAVIHYLHARHSMYQQIYQHKKNLASDFMLKKIIERMREANSNFIPHPLFEWINCTKDNFSKLSLNSYIQVDDFMFLSCILSCANNNCERLLNDLCGRFTSRNLFKAMEFRSEVNESKINEIINSLKQVALIKGLEADYYLGIEKSLAKPYEPYEISTSKTGKSVYIKQKNG
ncbi:MAG: HD domain-containing protein, partial [Candidatus Melainabacteria bacterium]|nr:HD domain-containing protein [Candidatus Melainabacteria bacterium]